MLSSEAHSEENRSDPEENMSEFYAKFLTQLSLFLSLPLRSKTWMSVFPAAGLPHASIKL
jgi:hypothetical protein